MCRKIKVFLWRFSRHLSLFEGLIFTPFFQVLYLMSFGIELWWIIEAEGVYKECQIMNELFEWPCKLMNRNAFFLFWKKIDHKKNVFSRSRSYHFSLQCGYRFLLTCWLCRTFFCPYYRCPCWLDSGLNGQDFF